MASTTNGTTNPDQTIMNLTFFFSISLIINETTQTQPEDDNRTRPYDPIQIQYILSSKLGITNDLSNEKESFSHSNNQLRLKEAGLVSHWDEVSDKVFKEVWSNDSVIGTVTAFIIKVAY
ncbi:hypothetical protein H4Q26_010759 [Puccinia striiformis f. sp. tritici PST-130]|nr:hypothetical protein H4Q26_010759 [Puccinia striiformis f. sp. tritici PST-130]